MDGGYTEWKVVLIIVHTILFSSPLAAWALPISWNRTHKLATNKWWCVYAFASGFHYFVSGITFSMIPVLEMAILSSKWRWFTLCLCTIWKPIPWYFILVANTVRFQSILYCHWSSELDKCQIMQVNDLVVQTTVTSSQNHIKWTPGLTTVSYRYHVCLSSYSKYWTFL